MSQPQYVDVFWDPDTGEVEIKIEVFADAVCDEIAKKVIAQLGVGDAKVTKTATYEGGSGQTRTQSIK